MSAFAAAIVLGCALTPVAAATEAPAGDWGALENVPGCDQPGVQRKGVQKREFLKRHRLELSLWGGFFAGDLVSTSYTYGGALGFYFTEDLGVEASLLVTPFSLAVEKPLTQDLGGQLFRTSNAFVAVADLVWSPVHLKLRASEKAIIHGDLAFVLGAGDTFHDTVQGVTFDAGLALKIYPTRWLAVRFDLRDYVMLQETLAIERVTNNIIGLAGVSFFLPPKF